jgi:hypothetical protein
MNVTALESPLRKIEGIRNAMPYKYEGDGDDIELRFENEKYIMTFSTGWGDCPAGCMNRHFWEFSLQDCQADFIRAYGDPLTVLKEIRSRADLFYPNPVLDRIYFNEECRIEQVHFYSASGIPAASFENISNPLDVSTLKPGFYLIRLTTDAGIISSGMIKIE